MLTKRFGLSIRQRLFSATILLGIIMAGIVLSAILKLNYLQDSFERTARDNAYSIVLTSRAKEKLLELSNAEKDIILTDNPEQIKQFSELSIDLIEKIKETAKELSPMLGPLGKRSMESFADNIEKIESANNKIINIASLEANLENPTEATDQQADLASYRLLWRESRPAVKEADALLDQIIDENVLEIGRRRKEISASHNTSRLAFLVFAILGVIAGLTISYTVGEGIIRDIWALSDYANHVGQSGDLSQPVPRLRNDEVGDLAESFDEMRRALFEKDKTLVSLNKKLSRNNKDMEQFLYGVSHDLKSPLVTCRGFLGLMKEDLEAGNIESALDAAQRIDNACCKMSNIIDDLLSLSRIGRQESKIAVVDVDSLVHEIVERYRERSEELGVELKVADGLPSVLADEVAVERVFDNLISNAFKYGVSAENPKIVVGAERNEGELRFFVKDNGKGIESEFHEKIFGLFQRLEKNGAGSGVGLASVAKIMELHNGAVWVESDTGKGATFWLSFPENV